ncbi:MAG: CHAD domain-containing protein [Verrucomicrobia bacterium]|nr:CHAD domain-containing protein [Verrucomicrobiota bacterium]
MHCLNKYRSKLIREVNQYLRIIVEKPEEDSVHKFRVGVKRLTTLYYFLNQIEPNLVVKKVLKPYRSLFKSIGNIRDGHIAVHLIQDLDEVKMDQIKMQVSTLRSRIRKDHRLFRRNFRSSSQASIRVPTVKSTGISQRAILRHKHIVLDDLLSQVLNTDGRMNAEKWHKKRILLKRYHHTLDAFQYCPGHVSDKEELKQIKMLEQLLGDWHDRVITIQILQSLQEFENQTRSIITILKKQDRLLLGSAKIYLNKFTKWHENR